MSENRDKTRAARRERVGGVQNECEGVEVNKEASNQKEWSDLVQKCVLELKNATNGSKMRKRS